MKIHASILMVGAALLLNVSPGWAQAPSSVSTARLGSPIPIYLYADYHGPVGASSNPAVNSMLYYQSNGNVYDAAGRVVGKLIDSAGHDIALTNGNGSYRIRTLSGTVIGTTDTPTSTSGIRTLTLEPLGGGWKGPTTTVASTTNGPVTADQGGTTTGSAISASIRSDVGGGLAPSDQNTTTGTSSVPNPNDKGGPSGPLVGPFGAVYPNSSGTPAPNPAMPTNAPSSTPNGTSSSGG